MEIGEKISKLRKKNNLSQEELAEKVGVARQTISKWELGETSPDLKQSKELSKIFNVSLDELTDNDIKDVLVEKTSNTEKLAGIILKLIKVIVIFIILLPFLWLGVRIGYKYIHNKHSGRLMNVSIKCNLNDKEYVYEYVYHENNGEITEAGGDMSLIYNAKADRTSDVYEALDIIDAYVQDKGGTCIKSDAKPEKK